jgi:hypothetical protein
MYPVNYPAETAIASFSNLVHFYKEHKVYYLILEWLQFFFKRFMNYQLSSVRPKFNGVLQKIKVGIRPLSHKNKGEHTPLLQLYGGGHTPL